MIKGRKPRKYFFAFILFIIMCGVYAGIMSVGNRYLRTHDLLNPLAKGLITFFLCLGMYLIYRRFSRWLDSISKSE